MKILFLVKTNQEYGDQVQTSKAGLRNSAKFVVDKINEFDDICAELDFVDTDNQVHKKIRQHKPDMVIFEAVWVRPVKLHELIELNPTIKFLTRVHSKVPFLAMEGNVIDWLREYEKVSVISFNSIQTSMDLGRIGLKNIYLPNIYPHIKYLGTVNHPRKYKYNIGCFGSIRPFKNQLNQAVAAMLFAESRGSVVHFHINSSRVEQRGETVLKAMKGLFKDTRHKLVEHEWLDHNPFLELISKMDACMQVSFTESFNIVTADCISQHIPIVVSREIEWLTSTKADQNNADDIAKVLAFAIDNRKELIEDNINDLKRYNHHATDHWFKYLKRF